MVLMFEFVQISFKIVPLLSVSKFVELFDKWLIRQGMALLNYWATLGSQHHLCIFILFHNFPMFGKQNLRILFDIIPVVYSM